MFCNNKLSLILSFLFFAIYINHLNLILCLDFYNNILSIEIPFSFLGIKISSALRLLLIDLRTLISQISKNKSYYHYRRYPGAKNNVCNYPSCAVIFLLLFTVYCLLLTHSFFLFFRHALIF